MKKPLFINTKDGNLPILSKTEKSRFITSEDGERYLSAKQAGRVTGYDNNYIGQLCRSGKVKGTLIGRSWYILESSLLEYKNQGASVISKNLPQNTPVAKKQIQTSPVSLESADGYLSTKQASELTGYEPNYIGQLCRLGKVTSLLSSGSWYVLESSIVEYKKQGLVLKNKNNTVLESVPVQNVSTNKSEWIPEKQKTFPIRTVVAKRFPMGNMLVTGFLVSSTFLLFFTLASATHKNQSVASVSTPIIHRSAQVVPLAPNKPISYILSKTYSDGSETKIIHTSQFALAFVSTPDTELSTLDSSGLTVYRFFNRKIPVLAKIFKKSAPQVALQPVVVTTIPSTTKTIYSQPVVQNITQNITKIEKTTLTGISDTELNLALNQLNNKIQSDITAFSARQSSGTGGNITNVYQQIASSQKIDNLYNTTINNPTISGGSISNTSVSATGLSSSGGLSVTGLSSLGDLLITGSTTLQSATSTNLFATNLSFTNLFGTNATTTNLFATNSTFTNQTITNLLATNSTTTNATTTNAYIASLVADSGTITNLLSTNSTTTNATSTNLFSTLFHATTGTVDTFTSTLATITGLNVANSTTTNATSTNSFITNLLATNATTTNFFATNFVGLNGTVTNLTATGTVKFSGVALNSLLSTDSSGNVVATSTPTFGNFNATSTTATNQIAGLLNVTGLTTLGNASTSQITSTGSTYLSTTGGNVGIGTTSPSSKLYVYNSSGAGILTVEGSTNANIIEKNGDGNTYGWQFSGSGNTLLRLQYNGSTKSAFNSNGYLSLGQNTSALNPLFVSGGASIGSSYNTASPTDGLIVQGNTGVGTTTPYRKFSVEGSSVFDGGDVLAYTFTATSSISTPALTLSSAAINSLLSTNSSGLIVATSTPTFGQFFATSTSATNYIAGLLNVSGATTLSSALTYGGVTLANSVTGTGSMVLSTSPTFVTPVLGAATYTTLSGGNITDSALTSGRIPYASTGGLLVDNSALTFDGTKLVATYASTTALTSTGSAYFATSGGNVGIGTTVPGARLEINGNQNQIKLTGAATDFGVWTDSNGLRFGNWSGVGAIVVDSVGNVGIGTTAPASGKKLTVSGDVQLIASNIYMDNNRGLLMKESGGVAKDAFYADTSNNLIFGATGYNWNTIGFYDNGATASMIIKGANVGIGSATPGYKLDVAGTGHFTGAVTLDSTMTVGATTLSGVAVNSLLSTNSSGVIVATSTPTFGNLIATSTSATNYIAGLLNVTGRANFVSATSTTLESTGSAYFATSGGNVGVGTTVAAGKLNVYGGDDNTNGQIKVQSTGSDARIEFYNSASAAAGGRTGIIGSGTSGYEGLRFMINNSDKMILDENGYVGIGTTAPGYPLDVVGIIRSSSYLIGTAGVGGATKYNFTTDGGVSYINSGNFGIGTTNPNLGLFQVNAATAAYNGDTGNIVISNSSNTAKRLNLGYDTSLGANGSGYIQSVMSGTGNTPLLLNANGGNVGVGTTAPQAPFQVYGASARFGSDNTTYTTLTSNQLYSTGGTLYLNYGVNQNVSLVASGSTGNVGIGTISPGDKLVVSSTDYRITANNSADTDGPASVWGTFSTLGQVNNPGFTMGGGTLGTSNIMGSDYAFFGMTGTNDDSDAIINWGDDTGNLLFKINNTELARIKYDGNVGIGSATPGYKLDVAGTGHFTGAVTLDSTLSSGAITSGLINGQTISSAANFTGTLVTSGNVGVGSASPAAKLDVAGAINLSSSTGGGSSQYWLGRGGAVGSGTTAMYAPSGSGLEFGIANSAKMVMGTDGNVGIGTTGPGAKLDVNGDMVIRNNFNTAAQVNVNGNPEDSLYFTTTAAGGGGNNYNYYGIASPAYTIVSGDYLEYDIYCNPLNTGGGCDGGTELDMTGAGGSGRGLGLADQNGISNHAGDISAYAKGRWYHRKVSLTAAVGAVLNTFDVVEETDTAGTYTYYYRKIIITNGTATNKTIWNGGNPTLNAVSYASNNSAYSVGGSYFAGGYFSGNVGIGTTITAAPLDIVQSSGVFFKGGSVAAGGTKLQISSGATGIDFGAYKGDGTSGARYISFTTDYNEKMRIDTTGNVGIGSATPGKALDVNGDIRIANGKSLIFNLASDTGIDLGSGSTIYRRSADGRIEFTSQSGYSDFVGNLGIGTTVPGNQLHIYKSSGDSKATIESIGSNQYDQSLEFKDPGGSWYVGQDYTVSTLQFGIGRSAAKSDLTINSSGSIGIGQTAPKVKLDIVGTAGAPASSGDQNTGELLLSNGYGGAGLNLGANNTSGYNWIQSAYTNNAGTTLPLVLQQIGGNVGIASTTPTNLLSVGSGSTPTTSTDRKAIEIAAGGYAAPGAYNTASNGDKIILYRSSAANYDSTIGVDSSSNTWFKSSGSTANSGGFLWYSGSTPTARMAIQSDGNVGIGTTAPTNKLQILSGTANTAGDSLTTATAQVTGPNWAMNGGTSNGTFLVATNDTAAVDVGGSIGFAGRYSTTQQSTFAAIKGASEDGAYNGYMAFGTRAGGQITERVRITGSGNVGIGTTNPGAFKLTVSGDTKLTGVTEFGSQGVISTDSSYMYIYSYPSRGLNFGTNNATGKMVLDTSGNLGIGTTGPNYPLDVQAALGSVVVTSTTGTNYVKFQTNNTSGSLQLGIDNSAGSNFGAGAYGRVVFADGAYPLGFFTNGTQKMTILSGGNVGVGTTAPGAKLQVGAYFTNLGGRLLTSNDSTWVNDGVAPTFVVSDTTTNTKKGALVGLDLHNDSTTNNTYSPMIAFSRRGNSGNYNSTFASILGQATGQGVNTDWVAGDLVFANTPVGGYMTESMRITSAGNVGIGTSVPLEHMELTTSNGSGDNGIRFHEPGVAEFKVGIDDTTDNFFITNNNGATGIGASTAGIVINSSGYVGIGTTAPNNPLQVLSGSTNTTGDSLTTPTAQVTGPNVAGTTSNGTFVVATNDAEAADVGGSIGFAGRYTSTGQFTAAQIRGAKEDSVSGNYGGYMAFGTRANGTQISEKMRITGAGNVGIGMTAPLARLNVFDSRTANSSSLSTSASGATVMIQPKSSSGYTTAFGSGPSDYPYIQNVTTGGDGAAPMLLNPYGGNISIGTTVPAALLDVAVSHGQYQRINIPSANNSGGTGEAGLYMWVSEPGVTWTGAGIGRNKKNGDGPFSRINTGLGGQMMRFDENNSILFNIDTAAGTGYNPMYMHLNDTIANGNIGVGSTVPAARLEIAHDGASTYGTALQIRTTAGTDGPRASFEMYNGGSPKRWNLGIRNSATAFGIFEDGYTSAFGTERFTILAGGNTGIGTTAPTRRLSVYNTNGNTIQIDPNGGASSEWYFGTAGGAFGANTSMVFNVPSSKGFEFAQNNSDLVVIDTNGNFGIGNNAPGYKLTVNGQPAANGYTAFTNYSDARLKDNVTNLMTSGSALEKISALRPVTFNYNSLSGYSTSTQARRVSGFIAQELQVVFPEMVGTTTINGTQYFDTNLSDLPLYLVDATQELNTRTSFISSSYASTTPALTVLSNGFVGVGTTTPSSRFSVFSNVSGGGVASFTDLNGTCTIDPTSAALVCSSDEHLKKDIVGLNATTTLDKLMNINAVQYHWNREDGAAGLHTGFIAQNVEQQFPEFVTTNPDGTKAVAYSNFIPVLVQTMQVLNTKVISMDTRLTHLEGLLASSTATTTDAGFMHTVYAGVTDFLASATNGIGSVFADAFHAKSEICVDDQCLNKDDVRALLALAHASATSTPPTGSDTSAPVISINGDNPATITVGTSYVDLGASVTDTDGEGNVNNNLGLHFSVDGTDVNEISLDTASTTTHTIVYSAVDGAGNYGYATRTVEVIAQ